MSKLRICSGNISSKIIVGVKCLLFVERIGPRGCNPSLSQRFPCSPEI